jgi:hypothetical protein
LVETFQSGIDQMFYRMHAALSRADEGSFEMYAERTRSYGIALGGNHAGKPVQRA